MSKATDPILTVLQRATDAQLWLSRSIVNENIQRLEGDQPSKMTVYRSFDELVDYGFVQNPDSGNDSLYQITDRGRQYLDGELDASEVDELDDSA
jgi:DNA-binding PadR family transcriptional regulator